VSCCLESGLKNFHKAVHCTHSNAPAYPLHNPNHFCSKRPSPFTSPTAPRWGFGLQLAQLWELVRDTSLVSRHTPLAAIDAAVVRAREPPPPVEARRRRVLAAGGPAAAAVLGDATGIWPVAEQLEQQSGEAAAAGSPAAAGPHDPLTELSFREFCEVLIRIAAARYPQVPGLARRLQAVLQQHLARRPSLAAGAAASVMAIASVGGLRSGGGGSTSSSAAAAAVSAAAAEPTWEQQRVEEQVVSFLRERSEALRRAFAAVASPGAAAAGRTTARAVLCALQRSGALAATRLTAGAVAAALLEGLLGAKDAAQAPRSEERACRSNGAVGCDYYSAAYLLDQFLKLNIPGHASFHAASNRLRLDCGPQDPAEPSPEDGAAGAAQTAEWRAREVAAWSDQPLTFPEFVWGVARVAALLPPPPRPRSTVGARSPSRVPTAHLAQPGAQDDRRQGLVAALQRLLDGPGGVLARLGGPAADPAQEEVAAVQESVASGAGGPG
jgi:hypothetical protein